MRDVPEIAPEVRGLLEEIVADPRSRIRLAPRRALSTWFDTGETARASDITRTKAERHLVEVHREELAALLCEASWISYWKAPVLAPRPLEANGSLFHPAQREPAWRRRAEAEIENPHASSSDLELLRRCLVGIGPEQGWSLALASLSLIPKDRTRCHVAWNAQWSKPRTAIALFRRLAHRAQPANLRPGILVSLGSQTCFLGLLSEAREYYRASSILDPTSPSGRGCAFNLSCYLDDDKGARLDAEELSKAVDARDPRVSELLSVLHEWRITRSSTEREMARSVVRRIKDHIPEVASDLCTLIES